MNVIKWIWQLPQNLLGLIVAAVTRSSKDSNGVYVTQKYRFGVSLGNYIIFGGPYSTKDLQHERGHQKQSLYLGPLYLLVIGVFSLIGNLLSCVLWFNYYKQPWEAWADKLGGVKR